MPENKERDEDETKADEKKDPPDPSWAVTVQVDEDDGSLERLDDENG